MLFTIVMWGYVAFAGWSAIEPALRVVEGYSAYGARLGREEQAWLARKEEACAKLSDADRELNQCPEQLAAPQYYFVQDQYAARIVLMICNFLGYSFLWYLFASSRRRSRSVAVVLTAFGLHLVFGQSFMMWLTTQQLHEIQGLEPPLQVAGTALRSVGGIYAFSFVEYLDHVTFNAVSSFGDPMTRVAFSSPNIYLKTWYWISSALLPALATGLIVVLYRILLRKPPDSRVLDAMSKTIDERIRE